MKYKNGFKSLAFHLPTIVYFIIQVFINTNIYGQLFLMEYLGILLGSYMIAFVVYSIGYLIVKGFKKVTKR